MIITFDESTLEYLIEKPTLKSDENIIRSLNNLLISSRDKEHMLLIDLLVIEYLEDNYGEVLDQSSLKELDFLKNNELVANEALLKRLPNCINIVWGDSVSVDTVNVTQNKYFKYGKMFNINILSFKSHVFLGNGFTVVSENESDVNFYKRISIKYMEENLNNHETTTFNSVSGIGGSIGNVIRECLVNKQKVLIICDPDVKAPSEKPKTTHQQAEEVFKKHRKNTIIDFVSLQAHEKENLLPVSWLLEFTQDFNACSRVLELENSENNDRLLYIDLKKGLKKSDIKDEHILSYYQPVLDELEIDFDDLQDEDHVFSKSVCSNWDLVSEKVLQAKSLNDFPNYLEGNIRRISLHFISWIIGGRNGIA